MEQQLDFREKIFLKNWGKWRERIFFFGLRNVLVFTAFVLLNDFLAYLIFGEKYDSGISWITHFLFFAIIFGIGISISAYFYNEQLYLHYKKLINAENIDRDKFIILHWKKMEKRLKLMNNIYIISQIINIPVLIPLIIFTGADSNFAYKWLFYILFWITLIIGLPKLINNYRRYKYESEHSNASSKKSLIISLSNYIVVLTIYAVFIAYIYFNNL